MVEIDAAFEATSEALVSLPLSLVRLQLDARFPWLVLIPGREGAVELEDLAPPDRAQLLAEVVEAGRAVRAMAETLGRPVAKLNVGQLGNVTRQLHVHMVGRRPDDALWPGPVWGQGAPRPYPAPALRLARAAALSILERR
jgi:diadenosine tetraphosphate (Ap4A) HIT family hydrolase